MGHTHKPPHVSTCRFHMIEHLGSTHWEDIAGKLEVFPTNDTWCYPGFGNNEPCEIRGLGSV
jgi:hypothetical protein